MDLKWIMALLLVASGGEIFFDVFSRILKYIISFFIKDFKINEKVGAGFKLIVVALFLASVVYFIVQFVQILASWLGIPLDKSLLDFFR